MNDLYKRLQVDPEADSVVIRAAYHALARKYHPDAGGDLVRMVEVNEAWDVLGNPMMRTAYDTERAQPAKRNSSSPHSDQRVDYGRTTGSPPRAGGDASSTLDFGRYSGWSLAQVIQKDPDYLEWMVRTSIGRRLSAEVKTLLESRELVRAAAGFGGRDPTPKGRDWLGRPSKAHR
jgi:curved DNA-binding protein CbpA